MAITLTISYATVRNRVLPPDWHQMPTPFRGMACPILFSSLMIVPTYAQAFAGNWNAPD